MGEECLPNGYGENESLYYRKVGFFDLLLKRRSIRDFQEENISLEIIGEIIRDSCFAPSSENSQPWKFVIINNKGWIKKLSDESKQNLLLIIEKDPGSFLNRYERLLRNKDYNVFHNGPCLVYIVCPKSIKTARIDCTLAACYFMFSAAARGLGTCWVHLGTEIRDPEILNEMGIPKDCSIIAPIVVGYPRNIPPLPTRKEPQILKVIT